MVKTVAIDYKTVIPKAITPVYYFLYSFYYILSSVPAYLTFFGIALDADRLKYT